MDINMKKFKKWTALSCVGAMAVSLLAGCGGKDNANELTIPEAKKENTSKTEADNAEKSMGRYLESEITVPEEVSVMSNYPLAYLQMMEDGALEIAESAAGKYISADNGESWEYAQCPWKDILYHASIMDIAFSPDGAAALIYMPHIDEEDGAEETGSGQEADQEDSSVEGQAAEDSAKKDDGSGEDSAAEDESGVEIGSVSDLADLVYKYIYYDADQNATELDLEQEVGEGCRKFAFDRQSRLYACMGDGKVYRIDPADGSRKELFEVEGVLDFICFTERYMIGFSTRSEVVIYDLENEIPAEKDKVLEDFISENLGLSIGSIDRGHSIIATAGEQADVIYFAFDGGLYRHVIGGTAIEQVIDGATSSLGDPSMTLMDMVMLPDNEFAVLYTDAKLYRYTYDPNVPTVPEEQIRVYSLVENYSMRQAVSLFQKARQDVYVRYEVGMSGEDGVTREDAIRNLNTKIMSGEGPDILLLDGLPQASYEEKGILADMSGVIDSLSSEDALFPNIVEACRKDGKIYTLPIRIQLPMMAGSKEYVQSIRDMETLADAVEAMREENPEGAILGPKSEEQLLYVLGLTCSAAWTDDEGNIDEEALEEFLTAATRIWQAEAAGLDADWLLEERSYSEYFSGEGRYYATLSSMAMDIAMKETQFAIGKVYRVDFDYATLTSLAELIGGEFDIASWNGQVSGGFIPDGLAGVCANSADRETVVEFYRFLYGRELQDMDLSGGLPVNMASFDTFRENPRAGVVEGDDDISGGIGISNESGDYFSLDIRWPKEAEFQKLREMVESASRISTGDATIEQAVYEIGPQALKGNMTPEQAVKEIVKKSAIYLAE